jgi:hypothetical protein
MTVVLALVEVALPLEAADECVADAEAFVDGEELVELPELPHAATTSATTPSSPTIKRDRSFIYLISRCRG